MTLNSRPKTLAQNVAYYSACMLLAASCWFHTGRYGGAMTAVAGVMVGLMLSRRVICRA